MKLKAALFATCILSSTAFASTINIFSTGVDDTGAVVAPGTIGDAHYQLVSSPDGNSDIRAMSSATGYPIGPWIGDDDLSRWIGLNTYQANGPGGYYDYRTTFTLTADQLAGAILTGKFAADDEAYIYLNGFYTGAANYDFSNFTNYSIDSTNSIFVVGENTLDFYVYNALGPTGLRVEADAAVPEPASLALLGIGFLSVAAMRRKSQQR